MPAFITPIPVATPRAVPRYGGKPPTDRHFTGGGGGGGDEGWSSDERGPRVLLRQARRALCTALVSDLAFFMTVAALYYLAHPGGIVFGSGGSISSSGSTNGLELNGVMGSATGSALHPIGLTGRLTGGLAGKLAVPLPLLLVLNTIVLMLSCLSIESARRRIFREIDVMDEWLGLGQPALKSALPWLATSLGLGILFLGGQWWAWNEMVLHGFKIAGNEGATSLLNLTIGLHAVHVGIGLVALTLVVTTLWLLGRVELRQIAVDLTAWYWQALGASWLLLLTGGALVRFLR